MATTTVLLHSPLLGPATWAPVAAELARAGRRAVVPDLRAVATAAEPWWPEVLSAVARAVAAAPGGSPWTACCRPGPGGGTRRRSTPSCR